MRIRVKKSRRSVDRITLNMASMIDVVFLLLIFFMVTQATVTPEDRLSPTLQTLDEEASRESDFQQQIVDVTMVEGKPVYRIGQRDLATKAELVEALRPLRLESGLIISVADQTPVEFAYDAIQAAHDAGFDEVAYVPTS